MHAGTPAPTGAQGVAWETAGSLFPPTRRNHAQRHVRCGSPKPPALAVRCCSERRPALPTSTAASDGAKGAARAAASLCTAPQWSAAATLPLVCRRWRHVFNTSSLLHGTLNLNLHQLEAQLRGPADAQALWRLLQLRGQAARRLWLHREGAQLTMARLLQLLSPQLQAVSGPCGTSGGP